MRFSLFLEVFLGKSLPKLGKLLEITSLSKFMIPLHRLPGPHSSFHHLLTTKTSYKYFVSRTRCLQAEKQTKFLGKLGKSFPEIQEIMMGASYVLLYRLDHQSFTFDACIPF